jgi:hypothetical protein
MHLEKNVITYVLFWFFSFLFSFGFLGFLVLILVILVLAWSEFGYRGYRISAFVWLCGDCVIFKLCYLRLWLLSLCYCLWLRHSRCLSFPFIWLILGRIPSHRGWYLVFIQKFLRLQVTLVYFISEVLKLFLIIVKLINVNDVCKIKILYLLEEWVFLG